MYAFERARESEECFIRVLEVLKNDKTADYYITLSYLLQFYIENGEQSKYEKYAKEFFNGEEDLEKQLHYLMKEGTRRRNPRFSFKYAFFLYIKAFYTFYKYDYRYQDLLRELTHIDDTVQKLVPKNRWHESLLTGHPWEIIYKYAALLESYDTEGHYNSTNRRRIKESVRTEKAFIIDRVIDFGEVEYKKQQAALHPERQRCVRDYEKSVLNLWEAMIDHNCLVDDEEASLLKKEEILNSCFTYMYH